MKTRVVQIGIGTVALFVLAVCLSSGLRVDARSVMASMPMYGLPSTLLRHSHMDGIERYIHFFGLHALILWRQNGFTDCFPKREGEQP